MLSCAAGEGGGEGGEGGGEGGEGGGEGGEGGEGGGGLGDGGLGEGGGGLGDGGGEGGRNCTSKELIPWDPVGKEKLPCPKSGAAHSAPFQPSPNESVMLSVHVAPSVTVNGTLEAYGAPPLSVVPSEQLRLQLTSWANRPLEQVIVEDNDGVAGGEGGDGGGEGGEGGGEGGAKLQMHL